jgi:hypothetical protein
LAGLSEDCIFTEQMSKFKKIDKEFLLSDSSLNCYSFRLLTSGYQLADYKKNPIGYRMHNREDGVVVKWEDLRVDGDKVYGKPVINLSNAKGQQTVEEIENGFLNAASVGHLVALEISKDPKDYLEGQQGPTIKKWYNRECSLVDIPGNYNALTDLVDANDKPINLADFKIQKINMKQIILTAAQLALIPNLKAEAEQADVDTAIANLVAEAAKVPGLTTDLAAANTAKQDAVTALEALQATSVKDNVTAQLDKAIAEKRITVEQKNLFATQYAEKPDDLKALLAVMKPFESVTTKTELTDAAKIELTTLMAKTGKELWTSGGLERLKALSEEAYKVKYKEAFDEEPAAE